MKVIKIFKYGLSWVIIFMLGMPSGIMAQDSEQTEQPVKFKQEELAQMLAPIALYPDSLLAEILMASTYPIEVVEAERWIKKNKDLKGDELDRALQEKTWDPSVKSLCHFPEVLYSMSEKLDQTTKMGDAFLSQQDDVMNTIQELRMKAQEQGNLKTTEEQKVVVEKEVIRIVPADPLVIYVPVYDPFYVYGPWWYPAYPPYYWYYPPGVVITGGYIYFSLGIVVGIGISSWCWFDWHHHHIYIDRHHARHFHRFDIDKRDDKRHVWSHEPYHRRSVAYRDRVTSQRFGKPASRISRVRPEARGYVGRDFEKRTREPSRSTIQRQVVPDKTKRRIEPEKFRIPQTRGNVFRGIDNGKFERKASERGSRSRQSDILRGSGKRDILRDSGQGGRVRDSRQGGGPRGKGR